MPLLNSTDVKIIRQYQQGNFTDIIELINYYPGVESPKILPKEDVEKNISGKIVKAVSYTHLRAHETVLDLVCRLLLEKKK